jgi:aryl-alcohol dehydrogenase-like predicted oxidoreductase
MDERTATGGSATLGVGTATLVPGYGMGDTPAVDGVTLVRDAVERGIRYLDTAAAYGASEDVLGSLAELLAERAVRIATKLTAAELAEGGVARALDRLRQPRLDTLLLHSAGSREMTDARAAAVFSRLKSAGLIEAAGVSTYGIDDARLALAQPWCDVVQVEFSILNPSVVRALASTRRPGQQVVVRSVLCKGLLTGRRRTVDLPASVRQTLDDLEALASEWSRTLPDLALRFALDTPGVDVVVIGASRVEEVDAALVTCAGAPLEAAQLRRLEAFDRSAESWTHPEQWTSSPN